MELDIADKNGKTPLMLAMGRKHSKIVSFRVPVLGRLVCLSDAAAVKHVLSSREGFPKSPTYGTLAPLIGRKSMVTNEGKEGTMQRAVRCFVFAFA